MYYIINGTYLEKYLFDNFYFLDIKIESVEKVDNNESFNTFIPNDKIVKIEKIFKENKNIKRLFIIVEKREEGYWIYDFIFDEEDDDAVRERVLTRSDNYIVYNEEYKYQYIPLLAKKITKEEDYEDEELNEIREEEESIQRFLEYILCLQFLAYLKEKKEIIYEEIEKALIYEDRLSLLSDDDAYQENEREQGI